MESKQTGYEWIVFVAAILFAIGLLAAGHVWKQGRIGLPVAQDKNAGFTQLTPHRAVYDIELKSLRSSAQLINISGKMTFEWNRTCDASLSAHKFDMMYEYADSPAVPVQSSFSNYEMEEGKTLDFNTRRLRNNTPYETIRGQADHATGIISYTQPEEKNMTLLPEVEFPTGHTLNILKTIREGGKFYNAFMFDGGDTNGPIEVNAFIGKAANPYTAEPESEKIDIALLGTPAHNLRFAFFPSGKSQQFADYEMSLVFHENGIMRDITIEYDDFSIGQKLVSLEKLESQCIN